MASSSQNQGLSKYVTLISSDGFEFVVLREAACVSGAIKRMLDPTSESCCLPPQSFPRLCGTGVMLTCMDLQADLGSLLLGDVILRRSSTLSPFYDEGWEWSGEIRGKASQ